MPNPFAQWREKNDKQTSVQGVADFAGEKAYLIKQHSPMGKTMFEWIFQDIVYVVSIEGTGAWLNVKTSFGGA